MEQELYEECRVDELVEAVLASGSDYKVVYRVGAPIALELEEATGKVIVTRGAGALKVGYLSGSHAEGIAVCIRRGCRYRGRIADVALGPGGKVLRLRLDPPTR